MKKINYIIVCFLTLILLPLQVLALGGITPDPKTITIEEGSVANLKITATNAAGELTINSKDSSVATIDKTHEWIDDESLTINVSGKKVGTTKITIAVNAATYDEEVIIEEQTITVNVVAKKSSNANLSSITISGKKLPTFDKNTTKYTLNNTNDKTITINAAVEDKNAKVSGIGTKNLNYGKNTFDIIVTAENGSKKIYTIIINRNDNRSNVNILSSLTVSPQNIDFSSSKTNYTLVVENDVEEIVISATAKDSKARVGGTGTKKLNLYTNTFNIIVTAENGSKKIYTITAIRKDELGNDKKLSADNYLENLVIDGYDIDFDKNTDTYNISVSKDVAKLNITAKSSDLKAQVKINNIEELKFGENTITIDVVAENGETRVYKIIVKKDDGIPRVTLDGLLNIIDETNSDTIIVNIYDNNNIITKEMLEKVKQNNKKLIVNKYINDVLIYSWELNGKDIINSKDINTLVEIYDSDKKLNKVFKNENYIYINNNLDTSIFDNIVLKIYVADKYNGEYIFGYKYDNNKLVEKYNKLLYQDINIEIDNIELGNYVITQNVIDESINIVLLIIVIILILIVILLGILYYRKKQQRYR